jgi:type VI secretion system protein ImpJ
VVKQVIRRQPGLAQQLPFSAFIDEHVPAEFIFVSGLIDRLLMRHKEGGDNLDINRMIFFEGLRGADFHPQSLGGLMASLGDGKDPMSFFARNKGKALALTFRPLMDDLRRSLSMVLEQSAIRIELHDRKHGVRVAVIPDVELQRNATFVLAVNAQMPSEALRARFPTQVKIGPVERIRDLVNLALPGVTLTPLPVAPRQIPFHSGANYFELETRNSDLWRQLEQSGGVAMHIAGDFPGLELELWAIRSQ